MSFIILLIVVGTSVWVYSDATAIGVNEKKSFFNPGKPLAWALHCLFLWIVFFPIYLGKRAEFKKVYSPAQPHTEQKPQSFGSDSISQLEKYAALKDKGHISEEEYAKKKKELLELV
jgi:hypothetical protein